MTSKEDFWNGLYGYLSYLKLSGIRKDDGKTKTLQAEKYVGSGGKKSKSFVYWLNKRNIFSEGEIALCEV